jgi:uncharacterized protein (TIGR02145 family)
MKSIGIVEAESGLWNWPNDGATNSIGFSGVPEGGRSLFGDYGTIGFRGCWWSTSEFTDFGTESFAWYRFLDFDSEYAFRYNDYKQNGFSVRCLRD